MGQRDESLALVDQSIRQVEISGEMFHMPELLRVKGGLLAIRESDLREVEICFSESLELSRRQGARAWELRTASDFAKFSADHGQAESGRALLQSVYAGFSEGFETADLKAAAGLLATLR